MKLHLKLIYSILFLLYLEKVSSQSDPYRLSSTVIPYSYGLTFTIESGFEETAVFQGVAQINFTVEESTASFEVHGSGLTFLSTTLNTTTVATNLTSGVSYNSTTQKYNITATANLTTSVNYTLTIEYNGTIYEDMYGIYKSWYENEDGETVWIVTTQFQPTYARRAFPCFDEPNMKAYFTVSIIRPTNLRSLTNTPLASTESFSDTLEKDNYGTTPKMSTYLLALIVSDYASISDSINKDGVWSRREAIGTGDYGFQVTPKIVAAYNNYTNISYLSSGIGKLDQVAIPDFGAGAMENWGLITYREYAILWDPQESSTSYKQSVGTIIAHELAHMWFGNLVTCSWWEYAWLNEGFAQYFQYTMLNEVETDWELDKQLVILPLQGIFASDSTTSSAALNSAASTPSEISYKFATTTYYKGASIIRMMRDFLGSNNFQAALQLYLSTYANSSTVPENLWDSLEAYNTNTNLPSNISTVMSTWTDQAGFPVVNVSLSENNTVTLTQQRFLLNNTISSTLQYYVPISFTNSTVKDFTTVAPSTWLLPNSTLNITNALNTSGWIIVNIQETGFYRVNYDETLWSRLITALRSSNYDGIDVLNRAQIIDDALNLARAGLLSYSIALDITNYLSSETEYYPWYAALEAFSYLRIRTASLSAVRAYLETHILSLTSSLVNNLSFEDSANETHVDILKKVKILDLVCELGHQTCVNQANALFNDLKNNGNSVPPNARSIVYCTAVRTANSSDNWYFLWDRYLNTKLATEMNTILSALGCTTNDTLRNEYLTKTITEGSGIRSQDCRSVFQSIYLKNLDGVDLAYEFLKNNYENISSYYGGATSLGTIISGIAARFSSQEQVDDLETFINEHQTSLGGALSTAQGALESARANLAWTDTYSTEITSWFSATYTSASNAITVSIGISLLSLIFAYFLSF